MAVITESVRTVKQDIFNDVQWGYLAKEGTILHQGNKYNYREVDFTEEATPGFDSATFTQDVKLLIPEVMNRQIITIIENLRVGRNLIDIIRVNGPSESFIKERGFEAALIEEGTEVPVGKLSFEKFFINVIKVGVRPILTYETIADGKFDIFRRHTTQAALAMAKYEDNHIMSVLNAGVPDGATIFGTKEADHTFASGGVLTWDLWVQADMAVQVEGLQVTDVIMHPYQAAEVLKMPEFRDLANNRFTVFPDRAEKIMATGQLPSILGRKLWVTRNQPAGEMLFVDRNNYGVLAERQPVLIETDRDIIHQMQTAVYTARYGAGIMNNDGSSKITGLATTL